VRYTEYDVSRDRAAAEEMVRMTGQMGVPVIVIDGEVIIGFDRARLQALLAGGNSRRPVRFGLKIADAGRVARKTGATPALGALVGAVSPGLLGARAGLQAGDIITEINTRPVSNAADMERALAGLRPGSIVAIRFRRNGDTRKSEIVA
jgi:S1-C subfamily serine protease